MAPKGNNPDEDTTQLHERVAKIEVKMNGGPGLSEICKFHRENLDELKERIDRLEKELRIFMARIERWAGGLAVLMVMVQIAVPVVLKFVHNKP